MCFWSPAPRSPRRSPLSPSAFASPVRARRGGADPPQATPLTSTSPSGSRLASLQSPEGTAYWGSMYAFTEIAIEDFVRWLKAAGAFFRTVPRPEALPGILDLTAEAASSTFKASNGNVRSIYLDALTDAEKHMPGLTQDPDVVVLAAIVMQSMSTANVFDWFDAFREDCLDWEAENAAVAAASNAAAAAAAEGGKRGVPKKRKREREELPEAVVLRCRFVNALSDLERFGFVKTKNGGLEVSRVAYVWMNNSASR